jgi:uncharacterized protein (DUF488 family)
MIFTAGHSTLTAEQFIDLLHSAPVNEVWDIRSYPSSKWEWFRRAAMERWLPEAGIAYRWVPALGGRRKAPWAPPAQRATAGWSAEGFYNYAWYTTTDEFAQGAHELIEAGAERDLAIMCAEGLWWRCHRSMVADYLLFLGHGVVHLQPQRVHHGDVVGDRLARYDAAVVDVWRRRAAAPAPPPASTPRAAAENRMRPAS